MIRKKVFCAAFLLTGSFSAALAFSPAPNREPDDSTVQTPVEAAVGNADSCLTKMTEFNNRELDGKIDPQELADTIQSLEQNNVLPDKFVTKKKARSLGWRPGKSLYSVQALQGKSIGGDQFNNFENQLPEGQWHEADLAYRGGHRNAFRLVYQEHATPAYVTVDHYQHFSEVPSCQPN